MSPAASTATAYPVTVPNNEPRCKRCGKGPLLRGEAGHCPYCHEGAAPAARRAIDKCRLCGVVLGLDDDRAQRICLDCATRPEGKRILAAAAAPSTPSAASTPAPRQPRAFTPAEKSLIKHTHAYMPTADLLRVLNERLVADVGAGAALYTVEQLAAEVGTFSRPAAAGDWGALRAALATARRDGLLDTITPQLVDDFAVVFQLSPAQRTHLHDVVRAAKEDHDGR